MLFFFAEPILLAASAISGIGFVSKSTALLLVGTIVWMIWLGLMLKIAVPTTDLRLSKHTGWLKRGAFTIFTGLLIFGLFELVALPTIDLWLHPANGQDNALTQSLASFEQGFAYNDATALCHQAAENLIHGENPYAHSNIVSATLQFGGSLDRLTTLREGKLAETFPYPEPQQLEQLWSEAIKYPEQIPPEFQSKLCYPAGCFLIPIPFLLIGVGDLRVIYLILVLGALAYVMRFIPGKMKLIFAAAALISLELWNSIANGENGVLIFPLLLIAWALPKRQLWVSAVVMGLAIATKQTAWFYLPFYLILLLREMGLKKVIIVMAIISGVFLTVNAPFIVAEPKLWFTSVMATMMGNMFPSGVGIVTLVTGGILNIQSSLVFGALEIAVFILVIICYFRYYHHCPQAGPILATLPLFFAWRSQCCYFFYAGLIMLAGIMINEYVAEEPQTANLAVA